jgi:hypothetical protein
MKNSNGIESKFVTQRKARRGDREAGGSNLIKHMAV